MNESKGLFVNLADSLPDAYGIIQDGKIIYVNSAFTRMTGYSNEELLGKSFVEVAAPEESPRMAKLYQDRLAGLAVPSKYDSIILTKSKARLPVEVSVRLITWEGRPATSALIRDISERLNAEAKMSRQIEELAALHKITTTVSGILDIEEVLNLALEKAMEVIKAEAAEIWIRQGDIIIPRKQKGLAPEDHDGPTSFKIGGGIPGLVVQSGKTNVVPNLAAEPRFLRKRIVDAGFTSMITIPLISINNQVIGAMDLFLKAYRTFTPQDISFAETVAQTLAIAIGNAMLFEEKRKWTESLQKLYKATHSLTSVTDFDELARQALEGILTLAPVDIVSASLLLLDSGKNELRIVGAIGADTDSRLGLVIPLELLRAHNLTQTLARALEMGEVFTFEDINKLPSLLMNINHIKDLKCTIIIPLIAVNNVIGFISLNSSKKCSVPFEKVQELSAHARHIATAIDSALHYKEIQQRLQELTSLNKIFQEHLNRRIKIEEVCRSLVGRMHDMAQEMEMQLRYTESHPNQPRAQN